MLKKVLDAEELFISGTNQEIWLKYCGFLDLSLDEFMTIQKALLKDQIDLMSKSSLGQRLMGSQKPSTIEDFRRIVPLTTFDDYEPGLTQNNETELPVKPLIWTHTSGRTGFVKWIPYCKEQLARISDDTIASFILSGAREKGEVHIRPGVRVILNLPPVPYITGVMASAVAQRIRFKAMPPLDEAEQMEFQERIRQGFLMALENGAEFAASIAVVLAKVGERFASTGRSLPLSSLKPRAALRLIGAIARAKLARRELLPKDIWKLRGLVCGGTDTSIYRDQIAYYWGVEPLDAYVATETGFIAMQAWDKSTMTFVPYTNFYEFISDDELEKNRRDKSYEPQTLLMNEVEPGKTYELVVTNFNGGPFMRYRMRDLVTITALENANAGITLPQMIFRTRADEIIDIAGFTRLNEKAIWQAIHNTGLKYEDWSARKEFLSDNPVLHIYLELNMDNMSEQEVKAILDRQLILIDQNYRDLRDMVGSDPLLVTILKHGTFDRYTKAKQAAGLDPAHLKPPHISPNDKLLGELLANQYPSTDEVDSLSLPANIKSGKKEKLNKDR